MLPAEDITQLDITVEDGFKFIISMGVIVPEGPATDFSQKNRPENGAESPQNTA